MLRKKIKKAFTLVELLVVIAILAILATVSVVGYTQFTKRARLSNDQTTVGMINDNLRALSVDGAPESASEALSMLYTVGFTSEKFTAYSTGFNYAYDITDNLFYLVDDSGNVTFPEEKSYKGSLWGLYRNENSDKIPGVTHYVALEPITDAAKFSAVFNGESEYTIDLNSYYIGISNSTKNKITLTNGSVEGKYIADSENGFTVSENDTTIKEQIIADKDAANFGEAGVIEGVTFDFGANQSGFLGKIGAAGIAAGGELTLRNCVFINSAQGSFEWNGMKKVVVENCTFVGSTKWAMAIGKNDTQYEIVGNTFYNCDRGINLQMCASTAGATVIENNTFILSNNEKAKVIQFADYTNEALEQVSDVCVIFRNNKVRSAVAVVNLHESLVQRSQKEDDGTYTRVSIVNLVNNVDTTGEAGGQTFTFTPGNSDKNYQKLIRFENNDTSSISAKVTEDVADVQFDGLCAEYMTTMVNYYNSIFQ